MRSILIDGLGHAWSGGNANYKFFDALGPDASQLIMEFLLSYRLPADLLRAAARASESTSSRAAI